MITSSPLTLFFGSAVVAATAESRDLGKNYAAPAELGRDWGTLDRWWLTKVKRGWTSVTFVIGRDGTIRHVHGSGAYFDGDPGFTALDRAVIAALDDPISR